MAARTLSLDGASLTLDDLRPIARGEEVALALTDGARGRMLRARALVEAHVRSGDAVYGLTTGFGKLKNVAIAPADLERLQENLVLSHCCGVGEPMPAHEVRIAQILRLNGLARGHSGITVELGEKLARLFTKGFAPVVPRKGSVGASGDLAPLAHMAAACMGHGEAQVGARRMPASEALKVVREEPVVLLAKEGLALINGTEIIKAVGVATFFAAENLSKAADAIGALTIEALLGSAKPFDERLAALKGHPGHASAAANVRACLAGSTVLESHAGCDRVQDPYSLRCIPQIHGATKDALAHVRSVLERELNAVTDNPIVFAETNEVVSAGQFHGQPLAMPLDYLAIALATLANVSERRTEQLVNPDLSGLPAFLSPEPGLCSGLMIVQVAAAALASENKVLAHPASVDTIPTSANQEDHVSMGVTAARKCADVAANVETVLALEWICAAQAREFRRELRAGKGAEAAHACLRSKVAPLGRDRYLKDDIEAARELLRSGALVAAVETAVGSLRA